MTSQHASPKSGTIEHYDAVIIGAGVSGMYALHHLREMGLSVRVFDGAKTLAVPGGITAIQALGLMAQAVPTTATPFQKS